MNIDEVIAAMRAAENMGATHLKPVKYAHLRGIAPQKVYYWIKTGKLEYDYCQGGCGEKVIEVAEADKILHPEGQHTGEDNEGEDEDRTDDDGSSDASVDDDDSSAG